MKSLLTIIFVLFYWTVLAQTEITISGRVTDKERGVPIAGATVTLEATGMSISTSSEGEYSLNLRPRNLQDTLQVRALGYTTVRLSVSLANAANHNFELEPSVNVLEEIEINTGYQKLNKRSSTGSVEVIDGEELGYSTASNLINRIDGLVSGAYLDRTEYDFNLGAQQPELTIRGESSIRSSSFPLVVVDNFPYEGDIENINPNDIESITVLKDAAASSIWGVRAGNGVLVITTKKGRLDQPLTVDVSSDLMVASKPDLFADRIVSSADFIDMESYLYEQGFYDGEINNWRNPPLSPVVHLLMDHDEGSISDQELRRQLDLLGTYDVRDDFLKYVYRNHVENNTSISLRGGGDKTAYSVSLGYSKNDYTMPTNGQERLTVRFNQSYMPIKKLTLSTDLSFTRLNKSIYNTGNRIAYNQIRILNKKLYPYAQLKDETGDNTVLRIDYDESFIQENQEFITKSWDFIPLDELGRDGNLSESQQVVMGLNLDYEIVDGVRLSGHSQLFRTMSESSSLFSEDSYYTRDLFNSFTTIEGDEFSHGVPAGGIRDDNNAKLWGYALRAQLDIREEISNDHMIQGLIGAEAREINNSSASRRVYGVYEGRTYYTQVDHVSPIRRMAGIGGSGYLPDGIYFSRTANRFVSFFSNINYAFKDRYFLSASARNDASNIFGVETKDKWSPLWSVGGGWEISKEPFFGSDILNYLKLRSSFGYSGNVDNSVPAELVIEHSNYPDFYSYLSYNSIVSLQNPTLRWEKMEIFNLALDMRIIQNKLNISIDYYNKWSKDLLGSMLIDPTLGASAVTANASELKGKGVDISIGTNLRSGYWLWSGLLRAGYNKTILEKYRETLSTVTSTIIHSANFIGREHNVLASLKWGGLSSEDGAPQGFDNGELSTNYRNLVRETPEEDLIFHGPGRPRSSILFRNRIGYKNFELGFSIGGQFSYYFRKGSINYSDFFEDWRGHADFYDRWQVPGDETHTDIPALYYPLDGNREGFYSLSEALVRRGDHLRLRDIRLSYRTSAPDIGLKNIEVFVLGTNLGLIWTLNPEGIDPVYGASIPPPLTITGGFKIGF
ncbi:SusC/RagA family TonB-linked outer membrane protein [Albibacterium indicum]|uniref:SusC/RagA family TonB-linked outer membrane protein n=1 Tax=Albibacterium indicum TaxID=2292082 RepID=UPI000E4DA976|nr:SusC/RagA family TonB-linked outer membrane protein [Pedobacter indicus]